ncbi:hypothetical protein SH661x_001154 [Planctomicrobium sp. SH661]|uniref:hypothetical protein n=1 Tax=Planctomicrobium sp. SH661 TaxID=3448124 RepID=UPI003F5B92D2
MTGHRYSNRRGRTFIPPARESRRLVTMICVLVLLGFMIAHTRRPETWSWLENHAHGATKEEIPPASAAPEAAQVQETLVPNPTDQDPEELAAVTELFRNVRDKIPMEIEEMPVYWRLFKWARAQPMSEMEARAKKAPFFTEFWERADKSRGKLFTLRLHIRRVLSHEAPENSAGVKRVYELWGVTDESRGHPYVVITSDLPPSIPEGADVGAEAVFTGYFMKVLGYEASDAKRGAPLLVGKIRALPPAPSLLKDPKQSRSEFWQGLIVGAIVLVLLVGARLLYKPRKSASRERLSAAIDDDAEAWFAKGGEEPKKPSP